MAILVVLLFIFINIIYNIFFLIYILITLFLNLVFLIIILEYLILIIFILIWRMIKLWFVDNIPRLWAFTYRNWCFLLIFFVDIIALLIYINFFCSCRSLLNFLNFIIILIFNIMIILIHIFIFILGFSKSYIFIWGDLILIGNNRLRIPLLIILSTSLFRICIFIFSVLYHIFF